MLLARLILILSLLYPTLAWSVEPPHDATTTGTGNNVDTVTVNHTVGGSCTFPIILTSVAWQKGPLGQIDTITIGGVGATFVADRHDGTQYAIELYRRVGVSTGANAIVVNFDGLKNSITVRVSSYCGVDQTTPTGTPSTANGSADPATVNVTSAAGERVVDAVMVASGGTQTITVGAGQTQRANFAQDVGNHVHGGSDEAGGASVTASWAISDVQSWFILGVPLKPAVIATGRWVTTPISF